MTFGEFIGRAVIVVIAVALAVVLVRVAINVVPVCPECRPTVRTQQESKAPSPTTDAKKGAVVAGERERWPDHIDTGWGHFRKK